MDSRLIPIFSRRSVRSMAGRAVADADLVALLEAGMAAPTASNRKPWHFVTVTDRARLDKLSEIHPYGKMLQYAGAAIAVCADKRVSPDFWVQDCSAATENILVAAAILNLASVWLGMHPRAEREAILKEFLAIPEYVGVLSLVAIGYATKPPEPRTQYDSERVHRDRW